MEFRNNYSAFDGEIELLPCSDKEICISRKSNDCEAVLKANLETKEFTISYSEQGVMKELLLDK